MRSEEEIKAKLVDLLEEKDACFRANFGAGYKEAKNKIEILNWVLGEEG